MLANQRTSFHCHVPDITMEDSSNISSTRSILTSKSKHGTLVALPNPLNLLTDTNFSLNVHIHFLLYKKLQTPLKKKMKTNQSMKSERNTNSLHEEIQKSLMQSQHRSEAHSAYLPICLFTNVCATLRKTAI